MKVIKSYKISSFDAKRRKNGVSYNINYVFDEEWGTYRWECSCKFFEFHGRCKHLDNFFAYLKKKGESKNLIRGGQNDRK
jgi:hypothetical protein